MGMAHGKLVGGVVGGGGSQKELINLTEGLNRRPKGWGEWEP